MRMVGMTVAFMACFALGAAVVAATGHCMTARWHYGPVCGSSYWSALTASPEVLVFMFFMITDPRTTPASRWARIGFGAAVAVVATVLMATQSTEFGTKVGILGGLAAVCCARGAWLLVSGRLAVSLPRNTRWRWAVAAGALGVWVAALTLAALAGRLHSVALPARTEAAAAQMVRDLADDLAVAGDALRHLDATRLATVSDGAWLAAQQRAVDAARSSGRMEIATWRPTGASVVLVHDPSSPQASPVLGVDLRGAVHREQCDARTGAVLVDEGTSPSRRLFVLDRVGGVFLITAEFPAA
jgi:hypothetical protein